MHMRFDSNEIRLHFLHTASDVKRVISWPWMTTNSNDRVWRACGWRHLLSRHNYWHCRSYRAVKLFTCELPPAIIEIDSHLRCRFFVIDSRNAYGCMWILYWLH